MINDIFLTAEWRHLAMLNWEADPAVLRPFVPAGTELDVWDQKTFVSVVGFMFLKTRVLGKAVSFHHAFEEVNLRFYVRRRSAEGWRRGVVFIKEIVPKRLIAAVARKVYNENYSAMPMRHLAGDASAKYEWRSGNRWNYLRVETAGDAVLPDPGTAEEFITEHYWGYVGQKDGSAVEYRVQHPQWTVKQGKESELVCDVETIYGREFVDCLSRPPHSAFLAAGSAIVVHKGIPLS